jgi:hypothetical protein
MSRLPDVRGINCSKMDRLLKHVVRGAIAGLILTAVQMSSAFATDVFMKNGDSYRDATIVKKTKFSLIIKLQDGRVKMLKQADVMESGPTVPRPSGSPSGNISTSVPGFYAFRDSKGKQVFTNKPEDYDPTFFKPVMVPLEKATFFRSSRRPTTIRAPKARHPAEASYDPGGGSIDELVHFHATRYGLSESLVRAVIKAESDGDPRAESHCGARGLMQLMPATAAEMGIYDLFNPDENIAGGTQYLAKMLEMFNGNTELALAAYNAGPGSVKKYNGIPPYNETKTYVKRVLKYEQDFQRGERLQLASASSARVPTPASSSGMGAEGNDFSITMTNGMTIRGTSYVKTDGGIQLKTSRKWEFVPNASIRDTNFT